jgi:hypothetical protein
MSSDRDEGPELGFGSGLRPVNRESQDIRINQWGADNSFSWDKKDLLKFGKGGVDDAEDAEVILHEYGHAIQDAQQTPHGFGPSVEAGSVGEGFADYWAVTVADVVAPTPTPRASPTGTRSRTPRPSRTAYAGSTATSTIRKT